MEHLVFQIVGLLVVAVLVGIVTRKVGLPYTVGLVVAGVGLAVSNVGINLTLSHDVIFDVILPPLLFEGALNIKWKLLRSDVVPVLTLAIFGVVISTVAVAAGLHFFLGWPTAPALVFAVLIAATDPVAVIAIFKDIGAAGRLRIIVECESLLNDGVSATLFALAVAWVNITDASHLGVLHALSSFVMISGGGIVVGLLVGVACLAIAGRTTDHLVETAVTTAAAYGSLLIAERFGFSGVLATVVAGFIVGNLGTGAASSGFSEEGREFLVDFWDYAAFLANSFIFLLFGLALANASMASLTSQSLALIVLLVLASRAISVYPLAILFRGSRWNIGIRDQHVLWWGGLRGALGLALALSLPSTIPFYHEILIATLVVVAFSVLVQGSTVAWVVKRCQSDDSRSM